MSKDEVSKELDMSYSELCQYLVNKYGPAQYDYFVNEKCKTKNAKVSRTSEGLECHHMDEDKAIMLSTPMYAQRNPFEYQKADRLVYCNALEHLILHIKIDIEPRNVKANRFERPGTGGALNFIIPKLNQMYSGYQFKRDYEKNVYGSLADSFDAYIMILSYWIETGDMHITLSPIKLCYDPDGVVVGRVYHALFGM